LIPLTTGDLESVISLRHFSDLDDYLFDFDSDPVLNNPELSAQAMESGKYVDTDCMKKFDYLDFVIMDVDS